MCRRGEEEEEKKVFEEKMLNHIKKPSLKNVVSKIKEEKNVWHTKLLNRKILFELNIWISDWWSESDSGKKFIAQKIALLNVYILICINKERFSSLHLLQKRRSKIAFIQAKKHGFSRSFRCRFCGAKIYGIFLTDISRSTLLELSG